MFHFVILYCIFTFNRSSDQSKYRVWDYPVKEQYTHILKMIEATGPVESAIEGYEKVEASHKGHFAFIHDAAEVKYMFYKNCNFIEVSEYFHWKIVCKKAVSFSLN